MTSPLLLEHGPDLHGFQHRILFVASPGWLPARSDGGSPMIGRALARGFEALGYGVGFVGAMKPGRWPGAEVAAAQIERAGADTVRHWFFERGDTGHDAAILNPIIASVRPDIVFCFGPDAASSVVDPGQAVKVTSFYDPPYLPAVYKRLVEWRYGDLRTRVRSILSLPKVVRRWRAQSSTMLPALASSDVIIGHAANHAADFERRLRRPVHSFANPLEPVPPLHRVPRPGPPAFILAGHVGSTVSMSGLFFLWRDVLPHLAGALEREELQIRIIGGGRLPTRLEEGLARFPNVNLLGYVDDARLLEEYAGATALLVPTPIPLGFRTRIVDAFRYGVPTIVHAANQAGFADLKHGQNCWMAEKGRDFAQRITAAALDPAALVPIAECAAREFTDRYSADVFCRSVVALAAKARQDGLRYRPALSKAG